MAASTRSDAGETPIPVIAASDLKDRIRSEARLLVLYGTQQCPFTRRFRPVFESFAGETSTPCVFGDLTEVPPDEWHVDVTPTVVAYADGEETGRLAPDHHTDLTEDAFRDFVREHGGAGGT